MPTDQPTPANKANNANAPALTAKRPFYKSTLGKVLIGGTLVVVGLLAITIALLPTIASSLAPGIIESAANSSIKGTVKVTGVSLSYGGPTTVDKIELFDPAGKSVGAFGVKASVGILGVLSGLGNVGTVDISGGATINAVEQKDGTTLVNLLQAIEPRPNPAAPASARPASSTILLAPKLAATINIKPLNIIYTATDLAGATTRSSLNNATGVIRFAASGPKGATASIEFDGVTDAQGTPGTIKLRSLVEQLTSADGTLTTNKATTQTSVEITGLPMAVIDALTKQGGLLQGAVGPTLAATLSIDGSMASAKASVSAKGDNLDLAGSATVTSSRVSLASPLTIKLASTAFVNNMPSLKASLTQAGIKLEQAPAVTLIVKSLELPLGSGTGADLKNLTLDADLATTAGSGTLQLGAATDKPKQFAITPLRITIAAAPLGTSLKATAATTATIDSQPAGQLSVNIDAKGLVTADNKFALGKDGLPSDLTATIELKNTSTALLQPFTKTSGLDLDLGTDLGPTVDLAVTIAPDGQSTAASTTTTATAQAKSLRIDASLRSTNINITAPLTLSSTTLTGRGDITIAARSLTPLLRRLTVSTNPAQTTTFDGTAALNITLADFVYPLSPAPSTTATTTAAAATAPTALRAKATATITDIRAALTRNGATVPLTITEIRAATTITGVPGQVPTIDLRGSFSSTDRQAVAMPFALTGQLTMPKPAGAATLAALGTSRIVGKVALTDVPTALIERLAALETKTADLAAALLGRSAGITVDLSGRPEDQSVNLTLTSAGSVAGAVNATLAATTLQLSKAELRASIDQPLVERIMQLNGATQQDLAGASLSGTTALIAEVKPVTIPLAKDAKGAPSLTPDYTADKSIEASITLGDVAVRNLKVGESTINGGLKGVLATAKLPLRAFGGSAAPNTSPADIQATITATVVRDAKTVATLAGNLTAASDFGTIDGRINVTDLQATEVDAILGKPTYISGAVGPKATIAATAKRAGSDKPLLISANITSDRLTVEGLAFTQTADRIELSSAKPITWNINKDWANANLLAKPAPAPPGVQLAADVRATATITKLTLAKATTGPLTNRATAETTGMFTPGVFVANIKLAIPNAALTLPSETGQRDGLTATNLTIDVNTAQAITIDIKVPTLTVTTRSTAEPSPAASANNRPPTQPGAPAQLTDRTDTITNVAISGTVQDLADARGNLQTNRAKFGLTSVTPGLPSSVLSLFISETPDNLARLLGAKLNLDVVIRAVTLGAATISQPGSPNTKPSPASEPGSVAAKLQSNLTAVRIEGPVQNGTLIISQDKPLVMKLAQFTVLEGSAPAKALPLFATIRKVQTPLAPGKTRPELLGFDLPPVIANAPRTPTGGKPVMTPEPLDEAIIYSRDLRIPIDGDMTKLAGQLTVDMGKVEFTYSSFLSKLVKDNAVEWGVDSSGKAAPPRMKPFTVNFDRGIAHYVGIEIPLSAQYSTGLHPTIKAEGTADLVRKQLDLSVDIPMSVASELLFGEAMGALKAVNSLAAGGLDKILSTVNKAGSTTVGSVLDEIVVPLRITGPFDKPTTKIDADRFAQRTLEILPNLLGKLGLGGTVNDAVKGISDLLEGLGGGKKK